MAVVVAPGGGDTAAADTEDAAEAGLVLDLVAGVTGCGLLWAVSCVVVWAALAGGAGGMAPPLRQLSTSSAVLRRASSMAASKRS